MGAISPLLIALLTALQLPACRGQAYGQASSCAACAGQPFQSPPSSYFSTGAICSGYSTRDASGTPATSGVCSWCSVSRGGQSSAYCTTPQFCALQLGAPGAAGSSVTQASGCPPPVSAEAAAATRSQTVALLGAGLLAAAALGALLYVPHLERLQGAPPTSAGLPPFHAVHLLFAAAALLWVAGAALLAAPTVPWLYYSPASGTSTYTVSAFTVTICSVATPAGPLSCTSHLDLGDPYTTQALQGGGLLGATYKPLVAAAESIGICGESGPGGGGGSLSRPSPKCVLPLPPCYYHSHAHTANLPPPKKTHSLRLLPPLPPPRCSGH
jgi:hypothetical protein